MTELDQHLDNILKASGSGLKNYSMQKSLDDMRNALKAALAAERERIHKAKECCILCEQKGVCNENTKDDETNTAKILGES